MNKNPEQKLPSWESLVLSDVTLANISANFGILFSHITVLNVSKNFLTTFPGQMFLDLRCIRIFDASHNRLSQIPCEIGEVRFILVLLCARFCDA